MYVHVVEYQHRGFPHAHIVYRIHGAARTPKEKETQLEREARCRELIKTEATSSLQRESKKQRH